MLIKSYLIINLFVIRILSSSLSEVEKSDETILYRNLQLHFGAHGDPLFYLEENRGQEVEDRQTLVR